MSNNSDNKKKPIILPPDLSSEDIRKMSSDHVRKIVKKWGPALFYKWKIEKIGREDKEEKVKIQLKFKPAILSAVYQKLWYPKTMIDRLGLGEMWYYDLIKFVYKPGGKDFFAVVTKKIWGDDFAQKVVTPTVYDIRNSTTIPRGDFTLEPKFIPQKNSILEIYKDQDGWKIRTISNTPHLYITSRYDVNYDPNAKNPEFFEFLDAVFRAEDEIFLQEYCGSILWFEAFLIACVLVGPTKYGKTEFTKIIYTILGGESSGNVKSIPIQTINDTYERYRLYKLPANIINEFSNVTIKDSSTLKAIITGAPISARTLRSESIDFIPFVKFLITTNDLPYVYEDSEAWWNKWQAIVVNKTKFDETNLDTVEHYHKVLTSTQEKRDAIFTWMVDGLLRLKNQDGKFSNRQKWEDVRKVWKSNADSLGTFLYPGNEWVKFTGDVHTPKSKVLAHYLEFCLVNGVTALSPQNFYKQMKKRYIDVDNPIIVEIKATIGDKQLNCYSPLECTLPMEEPPEEER